MKIILSNDVFRLACFFYKRELVNKSVNYIGGYETHLVLSGQIFSEDLTLLRTIVNKMIYRIKARL